MNIKEYEFYNGAVLNRLIRKGKPIEIDIFPSNGNNSFIVNNKIGLYIKYSRKKISPWRFTFTKEHQAEMNIMYELLDTIYLILVCQKDGIVCLEYNELKLVLDEIYEEVEWVSASRLSKEQYSIRGSNGALNFKISNNDFPKKILDGIF
tara:strand:+ start:24 stop:473 length:450 start_codon:yes stop_codon:yes gene_type:complete